MKEKNEELQRRIKEGSLQKVAEDSKKITLLNLNSYPDKPPKEISATKISFDQEHHTVFLPLDSKIFAIHVACIKNVTKHSDKKFTALRFNL